MKNLYAPSDKALVKLMTIHQSKGKGTKRPTMVKRKRDKKTNNGQKKKEQKDQQWSKGKGTKRPTMVKRKRDKNTTQKTKD